MSKPCLGLVLILSLGGQLAVAQAQLGSVARPLPQDAAPLPVGVAPGALAVVPADTTLPPDGRPWLSFPLAAALGFGGGAVGLIGGYLAGCTDEGPSCPFGLANGEAYLGLIGVTIGSTVGAHLGGLRRETTGAFRTTLLAAAVGAMPGLLAPKSGANLLLLVPLITSPIAATVADHVDRRPRPVPPG